jgi:transcriptional regulator with XRE-family HTH domain
MTPPKMDELLGAEVKRLREKAGQSVEAMARVSGKSSNDYRACEAGRERFSTRDLFFIAEALGTTSAEIFSVAERKARNF